MNLKLLNQTNTTTMPNIHDFILDFIKEKGYKLIDDEEDGDVYFAYRFHTIWVPHREVGDDFVSVILSSSFEITSDNEKNILRTMDSINRDFRFVKLYNHNNKVLFTVEFFCQDREQLFFLTDKGLKEIVDAFGRFKRDTLFRA